MVIDGWLEKPISSVAEIVMGQSPDSKYYSDEEVGLPFLQGCSEFTNIYPSPNLYCSQLKKIAPTGSILFSVRAPVGKINLADQDYIIGRGLAALSASSIPQDYLHYYLVYSENKFRNASQGSTFEAINSKELNDWCISFPEGSEEQTQIAAILSTIDRAITETEAIIAKQQRIKTGLMQDLLTKGIDDRGNIRTEETHTFKDSPFGRIPAEWKVEPCSAICREIVVGIVIRPAQYYKPSGIPVLRSANVRENAIDFSDLVYMSEKDNNSLGKSCLSKGDLVTVRTGYPGTTAVIPPELNGSNCVDIVISRPDSQRIRSDYLAVWINSNFGKKQVLEGQGGLAQQHFNVGEVRKLLVNVPAIEEQARIEDFLLIQSKNLLKCQQKLQKLHRMKTGLMQNLLTGKVRVTELLKDIKTTSL